MASRAEKIEVNRGGSCVGVCMRCPRPLRVHGTTTELTYPGARGDRGFESCSLQRRVCLPQDFIFGGQEPRLSARVSRLRSRRGRQRAAGPANIAPTRSSISVGLYSSTAFLAMRSRQVIGLKSQGRVPKPGRASSRLRDAGGSCELGSGSSKAERGPLIVPA